MLLDVGIKKQHIDEMSRHDGVLRLMNVKTRKIGYEMKILRLDITLTPIEEEKTA